MAVKRDKLTLAQLKAIVQKEISNCQGTFGATLASDRRQNLDYYNGEAFGNEIKGRSQVVTSDTLEAVEWAMPSFTEVFNASNLFDFEAAEKEDEAFAKQASEYINFIVAKDNPGFEIVHDWVKDGLISKCGFLKLPWVVKDKRRELTETAPSYDAFLLRKADLEAEAEKKDAKFEILEETYFTVDEQGEETEAEAPGDDELTPDLMAPPVQVRFKYQRTEEIGRVVITPVPPEEMLISRNARRLQWLGYDDEPSFVGHRTRKTETQLIDEGYDEEQVRKLPAYSEQSTNQEKISRDKQDDAYTGAVDDRGDQGMREIEIVEGYLQVDWDNDGRAEYIKVMIAGESGNSEILEKKGKPDILEVDDHPFVAITPIRMPHKVIGKALADLTRDIQLIKSTLVRQILDNAYNINNGRMIVNERVILADAISPRPNQVVRVKGEGNVQEAMAPIWPNPIAQHLTPLVEYMDQWRDAKTGVLRGQGLPEDALKQMPGFGISLVQNAAQQRIKFMARTMAETGFKDLGRKLLRLVIAHQDKPRAIRLRNEWVDMDPRPWNAEMDVTINVGIGYGNKAQEAMMLDGILLKQEKIIMYQGSPFGPIVGPEEILNTLEKQTEAMGYRSAEPFYKRPTAEQIEELKQQAAQAKPDPKMVEVQQKDQRERVALTLEHQRKMREMGQDYDIKRAQLEVDAAYDGVELAMKERVEKAKLRSAEEVARGKVKIAAGSAKAKTDIAAYSAKAKASQKPAN